MTRPSVPAIRVIAVALVVALNIASAQAEPPTPQQVQALVTRAAAHIQDVGPARAFADFSRRDGGFVDGELYIFCDAADGTSLAHGGNPKLVGKSLIAMRDPDGIHTTAEIVRLGLTEGHGWLEYRWPNPATGLIERKKSYVLRIDDQTVCGSGYFETPPP
jgi:hypothetical protein